MSFIDMKPPSFSREIRRAIANPILQSALDANSERRLAGRHTALSSLPDYLTLRQRAHDVRADVIANLDHYQKRFMHRLEANGMIVHRAADSNQAVQIVLDIARQHAACLIAKSKTMVSEEIELNHALQASGIQAIETDLGEYIVQLRGEAPSHIITPAVHLRREEVGLTFQEKLNTPYTTDIPTLTQTARRVLRQVFLDADIGLSGVNFGVVETGTLCILTNEGNGRMVTTLPPVHIALMGIERMVPSMDDLVLMLSLLPRSATGQKITVYTNLIHSPRQFEDPDGPNERHLVLIDNGRSAMRTSPLSEALLCIRCGACLNACPVYREIGGHAYVDTHGKSSTYPGPIGSVISPGLFGQLEFSHLARASTLCGACKDACPVDIDLPSLLLRVRAGLVNQVPGTSNSANDQPNAPALLALGLRLFSWFAVAPRRYALAQRVAGTFARLASRIIGSKNVAGKVYLHLPAFTGWGYSKDFPQPTSRTFHQRWQSLQGETSVTLPSMISSTASDKDADPIPEAGQDITPPSLVARFEAELTALGGSFILCTLEELPQRIVHLLHEKGEHSLLSWGDDQLPSGFVDSLRAQNIKIRPSGITANFSRSEIPRVGLTAALAGIAETGSLVLTAGKERPLTASLLPEVHIAVIQADDILPTVKAALQLPELLTASSAVLITGPSRTADIEMTLTIGVHGPAELIVFCLED
jgi:L-lactate dehydrogenase complex protein LldF